MALEKEAYRLSVYVLLTAKLTQPSLFWSQKIGDESKIMGARTQALCDKYSVSKRKADVRIRGQKETVKIWRDLLDEATTTRNISHTLVAASTAAAWGVGLVATGIAGALSSTVAGRAALNTLFLGNGTFLSTGIITQVPAGLYLDLVKGDQKMRELYRDLESAFFSIPFYSESNVAAMDAHILRIDEAAKKVDFNWSRWEDSLTFGAMAHSRIKMMHDLQEQKMKSLVAQGKFFEGVLAANGCN